MPLHAEVAVLVDASLAKGGNSTPALDDVSLSLAG